LFGGDLDNGHCDTLLPVEEKEKLGIFDKLCSFISTFAENILFK
jgi:hypothetical protein